MVVRLTTTAVKSYIVTKQHFEKSLRFLERRKINQRVYITAEVELVPSTLKEVFQGKKLKIEKLQISFDEIAAELIKKGNLIQ